MLTISTPYSNPAKPVGTLQFIRLDLRGSQARHRNRYALAPRIHLENYKCRAVIDFVELEICTAKLTGVNAIRSWIIKLGVPKPYCKQLDGTSNSATCFKVTIQDPIFAKLSKLESMFRNCPAGLASPVKLRKVEVSVDFIPHNFGDAEREAMVVALQRTYLPQPDVWKTRMSRPRFSWGRSREETSKLMPETDAGGISHQVLPRTPFLDSTLYFRPKNAPGMIRIQNKVSNERTGDVARELTQAEKRARIEVVLAGDILERFGLIHVSDLKHFSFAKLQGEFFHFALPTFPDAPLLPQHQAIHDALNQRDRTCFAQGGVVCVERSAVLKERWYHEKTKTEAGELSHLSIMRGHLLARGITPRDRRAGRGSCGTSVAYDALNDMVRSALRDLGRRINRGERRSGS